MAYKIDLTPHGNFMKTIAVSQNDVGRDIEVALFHDDDVWQIPSGSTVTMHGTKPSGLGFTISGSYTSGSNEIIFTTTSEMTEEHGRFAAEIVITDGSTEIGTANFILFVEKTPHPSNTIDGNGETMQSLEERIEALEADGLNADGAESGYVPTADGAGGWSWAPQVGGVGQPIVVTLANQMTDPTAIYLYLGNESGYEYGYIYVWLNDEWVETSLYGKGQDGETQVLFNTTAGWNATPHLVSESRIIYVYTDRDTYAGHSVAGFKVGDGNAYLIDLPFTDTIVRAHIANTIIHVTSEERNFWNNKVRCYYVDGDELIFTTS